MVGYRLCTVRMAKHPFFIESIGVNLYSIEELCFFLQKNMPLIDESIVSLNLVRWVAEELGLGETALKMEQALRKQDVLSEFILPLYQDTHYLDAHEIRHLERRLESISSGPLWERMKKKADALAQNGKFSLALRIYYEALGECEDLMMRDSVREFHAAVWYQIGVVHMQLFEYEDGCQAFLKSVELVPDEKRKTAYLMALKLTLPSEKYEKQLRVLADDWDEEELQRLKEISEQRVDEVQKEAKTEEMDDSLERLHELVRAYHSAGDL